MFAQKGDGIVSSKITIVHNYSTAGPKRIFFFLNVKINATPIIRIITHTRALTATYKTPRNITSLLIRFTPECAVYTWCSARIRKRLIVGEQVYINSIFKEEPAVGFLLVWQPNLDRRRFTFVARVFFLNKTYTVKRHHNNILIYNSNNITYYIIFKVFKYSDETATRDKSNALNIVYNCIVGNIFWYILVVSGL